MKNQEMGKQDFKTAAKIIKHANRVLITSHIRADGDAIGALLGIGLALEQAGKDVSMVLKDGVARIFRYLPGWEKIKKSADGNFDLVIVVDCADLERAAGTTQGKPIHLNIDHHITNTHFGELNLIKPKAVATCAILAEWLPKWNMAISKEIAEVLLVGIITDTIGFRTTNMNPKALRIAADLMEFGADLPLLYSKSLMRRHFEAARYWGYGLSDLKKEGKLIWSTLTLEDRKSANYPGSDDADLCNLLSNIEGCDISVLFIEQKNNKIKVSWRAPGGQNVADLAVEYGGGGHPAAAGADIHGSLEEVKEKVLNSTRKLLHKNQQKLT